MSTPVFGAYAARYVEYGFKVFPCVEKDKRPKTKNGFKDATDDQKVIADWASRWPAANIGLVMGDRYWVLDIDGAEGQKWLDDMERIHGLLPETPEVRTGKGRHIYFRLPEGVKIGRKIKLADQVDICGGDGYVIAPPSIHPNGGVYTWHAERRPTKIGFTYAPDWLLEMAMPKKPAERQDAPAPRQTSSDASSGDRYIQRAFNDEIAALATTGEGGRNDKLNRAAFALGSLVGQGGLTESQVRSALIGATKSNGLYSENPSEVEKTIASGLASGMAQPRQIPEPPQRKKKPKPQNRPTLTIVPETGEIINVQDNMWRNFLLVNNDGEPKPKSHQNAITTLRHHADIKGALAYDEFADRVVFVKQPPWDISDNWEQRSITDEDAVGCAAWLESDDRCRTSLTPSQVFGCMIAVAKENPFDPAKEWLNSLEWDGLDRLSHWLVDHCDAEDSEYTRAVSRKFLISAVARVLMPGCKVDNMPIFEGTQGLGKSTMLRVLGTWDGECYFTDQLDDITNKDGVAQMMGFVIVEFAELDTIHKAEASAIKKFITRQTDNVRPPYARLTVPMPRRCVFAGTVNPSGNGYLKDPTGARRFWPVKVGEIQIDNLRAAVKQLWAQAVHAFKQGERHWMDTVDLIGAAQEQQSLRYEEDAWSEQLTKMIEKLGDYEASKGISMSAIMDELNIDISRRGKAESNRISAHMKSRGWEYKEKRGTEVNGKRIRKFYPPALPQGEIV